MRQSDWLSDRTLTAITVQCPEAVYEMATSRVNNLNSNSYISTSVLLRLQFSYTLLSVYSV